MLVIRFKRIGKKNQPFFRIVVTESKRSAKRGRSVEEVGFFNPLTKEKSLKGERIKYWISVGAKPSDRVHNLLVSGKIIEGKKIDVHKKAKKTKEAEAEPKPAAQKPAETPVQEAPKEEKKEEAAAPEQPKTEQKQS